MLTPSLILQSNELAEDIWWIAGAAVVLAIVYFLTRKFQRDQKTRDDLPPEIAIVNDTNYNIDNTGVEQKDMSKLSAKEADEVIDKMDKSDYIPSDKEFFDLKDAEDKPS